MSVMDANRLQEWTAGGNDDDIDAPAPGPTNAIVRRSRRR